MYRAFVVVLANAIQFTNAWVGVEGVAFLVRVLCPSDDLLTRAILEFCLRERDYLPRTLVFVFEISLGMQCVLF